VFSNLGVVVGCHVEGGIRRHFSEVEPSEMLQQVLRDGMCRSELMI